ncbi:MAG: hypothetical protein PHZ01_00875 [Bacteroidales bacterium]|nr:hypothetical protein [Bacteroidales bacterium]MDD5282829.1 hypothetical protein [Bacteroidales bacterium]
MSAFKPVFYIYETGIIPVRSIILQGSTYLRSVLHEISCKTKPDSLMILSIKPFGKTEQNSGD